MSSMQLILDKERYVSLVEATQMRLVIFGALQGFSRKLLYGEYRTKDNYYVSPEHHKKHGSLTLENTEVRDFL